MKNFNIGMKLSFIQLFAILLVIGIFVFMLTKEIHLFTVNRTERNMSRLNDGVINLIDTYNQVTKTNLVYLGKIFGNAFPSPQFSLNPTEIKPVNQIEAPVLRSGPIELNNNLNYVDQFSAKIPNSVATVFVRKNEDFIRVATSVKKEDGSRAMGTKLDHTSPAYQKILNGDPFVGKVTLFNQDYMVLYDPIFDDHKNVIGILFIGLTLEQSLAELKTKIAQTRLGEQGGIFVFDQSEKHKGKVLLDSRYHLEGKNILEEQKKFGLAIFDTVLNTEKGKVDYALVTQNRVDKKAQHHLGMFLRYPEWKWTIFTYGDLDELNEEGTVITKHVLIMSAILIITLSILLYFLSHYFITKPLKISMHDVKGVMHTGDLSQRVRVLSSDEIGKIAQSFNALINYNQKIVTEINHVANAMAHGDLSKRIHFEVKGDFGKLLDNINTSMAGLRTLLQHVIDSIFIMTSASEQISAGNHDLANRTVIQASQLEQTAQSLNTFFTLLQAHMTKIHQTQEVVLHSKNQAEYGGSLLKELTQMMQEVAQNSNKISDIIHVINNIAEQTNLLALNAAIEAARAGESGRGFAVVADEVRTLAQRSASAAQDINHLITQTVTQIQKSHTCVETTEQAMSEVVHSVQNASQFMNEIMQATHEEMDGMRHVQQSVEQLNDITQQNAALVEEVSAASESLTQQGKDLRTAVEVFHITEA